MLNNDFKWKKCLILFNLIYFELNWIDVDWMIFVMKWNYEFSIFQFYRRINSFSLHADFIDISKISAIPQFWFFDKTKISISHSFQHNTSLHQSVFSQGLTSLHLNDIPNWHECQRSNVVPLSVLLFYFNCICFIFNF